MMLCWRRLEVSYGFLLIAALLYYLDVQNILPWVAGAAVLHELGHYITIYLLGGRIVLIRLTCIGAEMVLSTRHPLSRLGQLLAALAGPASNLILAFGSAYLAPYVSYSLYLFAGLNLSLAIFNLLPVRLLDGGRALCALLSLLHGEEFADHIVSICSVAVTFGLLLGGGLLVLQGQANFTLLLTAAWLFTSTVTANTQKLSPI